MLIGRPASAGVCSNAVQIGRERDTGPDSRGPKWAGPGSDCADSGCAGGPDAVWFLPAPAQTLVGTGTPGTGGTTLERSVPDSGWVGARWRGGPDCAQRHLPKGAGVDVDAEEHDEKEAEDLEQVGAEHDVADVVEAAAGPARDDRAAPTGNDFLRLRRAAVPCGHGG